MSTRLPLLVVASGVSAGLPLIWELLRQTPLARSSGFTMVDMLGPWLYLPALALPVVAAAVRGDRVARLLVAVGLIVFSGEFGRQFVPHTAARNSDAVRVRVMTANLEWETTDPSGVVAQIDRARPDIVALQEVNLTMAERLGLALADRYPFQELHADRYAGAKGMGIVSALPLVAASAPDMSPQGCFCQEAQVRLGDRTVTVLNVHPRRPTVHFKRLAGVLLPTRLARDEQEDRTELVLSRAEQLSDPVIVLGDFNVSDRQWLYNRLTRRFRDAYREAGWGPGYTFPSPTPGAVQLFPILRIDYILVSESWSSQAAWSVAVQGSDHRSVLADLSLP